MNRYTLICRLRAPAFILLTGIIALLSEWHILSWGRAWPLYLILAGVLQLAERAALASMDPVDFSNGYPPQGQPPANNVPPPPQTTAMIPTMPENHSGESGR